VFGWICSKINLAPLMFVKIDFEPKGFMLGGSKAS